MFCKNCGAQIDDSAKFCTECGCAVSTGVVSSQTDVSSVSVKIEETPAASARGEIKKIAKGGLFLTVAILLSLGLLMTFGDALNFENYFDGLTEYLYAFDIIDYEMAEMFDEISAGLSSAVFMGTLTGNVPTILIVIGIWILFGTAVKKDSLCPSLSGLTLCKVASTIAMVCDIVGMGLLILTTLILAVVGIGVASNANQYAYYYEDVEYGAAAAVGGGVVGVVFGIMFLIFCGILVFNIIYYVKLLKTIKNVRYTMETGVAKADVSRFTTFMCFFSGCASGFLSLISVNLPGMVYAAVSIIFGVILVTYKNRMTKIIDSEKATVQGTAVQADAEISAGNL